MNIWDAVDPVELTGYVRAALADRQENEFTLSRWLPNRPIADLEYRFHSGGDGLIDAAVFRTYDAEAPIGNRPGRVRVTGELPPISRKIRLGEYDRLRIAGGGAEATPAIEAEVYNDAVRQMRSVAARLELARGEALYKGRLEINENGVVATVDFGRAATHTVAPAILWTDTVNAVPLSNLIAWQDTYIATNGEAPGAIVTSTARIGNLLRNAEMRALIGGRVTTPSRINRAELDALLNDHGLPPIVAFDAQVRVNGVATRVVPADRVLLLPAPNADPDTNEFGGTLYGITAEALELQVAATEQPGIVAVAYRSPEPVAVWTKAAGIALPVLANPDLSFAADVA